MSNSKKKASLSGKRLQERYSAIGVSQTRFASLMKRTQPAVSQWVHGKVRVPDFVIERLAELEERAAAKGGKLEEPKPRAPRKPRAAAKLKANGKVQKAAQKAKAKKALLAAKKLAERKTVRLKKKTAEKSKASRVTARAARPYKRKNGKARRAKAEASKPASAPVAAVNEAPAAEAQTAS